MYLSLIPDTNSGTSLKITNSWDKINNCLTSVLWEHFEDPRPKKLLQG